MIKDKLKEIRENSGMNKKEFANCIDVKYTTYNGYETGTREPDSDFLVLIAKKFDVSTDYILGLRDEREIAHSYQLKASEYEHIKKYRDLDDHGKDMVNTVLEKEHKRWESEQKDNSIIRLHNQEHISVNAAHTRTDIHESDRTEEAKRKEEDIMDNPDF